MGLKRRLSTYTILLLGIPLVYYKADHLCSESGNVRSGLSSCRQQSESGAISRYVWRCPQKQIFLLCDIGCDGGPANGRMSCY